MVGKLILRKHNKQLNQDASQPAVEREITRLNTAIEKVVVSDSLQPDAVEGWGPTPVVRRGCFQPLCF